MFFISLSHILHLSAVSLPSDEVQNIYLSYLEFSGIGAVT